MEDKLVKKWKPIMEMMLEPIKIHHDIEIEISKWLESSINNSPIQEDNVKYVKESLQKFKNILLTDNRYNIKIIETFYNPLINEICYKLENGDVISNNQKQNESYYTKYIINLFYSIVNPVLARQEKIKQLLLK